MTRRIRWHGDPGEPEQPDAGDVLSYVDPDHVRPDWFELVHYATQVRGGQPHDLWLVVTRHDLSPEGHLPEEVTPQLLRETGRVFPAEKRRRGRR